MNKRIEKYIKIQSPEYYELLKELTDMDLKIDEMEAKREELLSLIETVGSHLES